MNKLSIRDLDMAGKRVFIRVDFNVPLDGGKVSDDTRIRETLPTLRLAIERGARLVLASHLGRPKGKPESEIQPRARSRAAERTARQARGIRRRLRRRRSRSEEQRARRMATCCCSKTCASIPRKKPTMTLLEATRRAVRRSFRLRRVRLRASRPRLGCGHHANSCSKSAAGLLMEKELAYLGKAISNPERPFVAVLGGAKVSDKIEVVQNLMKLADAMLIGGAMAYTFLKSQGLPVGKSLVENDKLDLARNLLDEAQQRNFRLLLPVDHVLAESPDSTATKIARHRRTRPKAGWASTSAPRPSSCSARKLSKARTIVWNGPLGMFEKPAFAQGTLAIARAVAAATTAGATSIIGGGDSVAAAEQSGVAHQISHISTGGGASLEFLAGEKLPGVEALTNK